MSIHRPMPNGVNGPGAGFTASETRGNAAAVQRLSLRPREAAAALGISERTLWSLTQAGDVPHVKLGRATLYPVRELAAWLAERANSQSGGEGGAR